eukprot:EG_transcript_18305
MGGPPAGDGAPCRSVRVVSFDATNTLWRLRAPVGQFYRRAFEAAFPGLPCPSERALTRAFVLAFKAQSSQYPNFGHGTLEYDGWWRCLITETFRVAAHAEGNIALPAPTDPRWPALQDALLAAFSGRDAWELFPGVQEVLRTLHAGKWKLAVLSDSDPRLHDILAALGVEEYFSFVGCSYESGHAKPDPAAFQGVAAHFGVPLNQVLHVGDDARRDYHGATQAGLQAIHLRRAGEPAAEGVAEVDTVESLAGLLPLLSRAG